VKNEFSGWFGEGYEKLNITTTYNLLYNASIMVEEGMGYALCLDKIVRTSGGSPLCFRPLEPKLEVGLHIAWKKYQFFSKAAEKFLECLQRGIGGRRIAQRTNRATGKRTQKGKRGFSGKTPLPLWSIFLLPTDYIRSGVRLQWRSR
jgi:hypothetical protein